MKEDNLENVKAFAEVARRYCNWAEEEASGGPVNDMRSAYYLLVELHMAILNFPEISSPGRESSVEEACGNRDCVRHRLGKLPINFYWTIFNPLAEEEPVCGSLIDDMEDIYCDLSRGSVLFEAGLIEEAAWEWRFNFSIHWGLHLMDAQRIMFKWLSDNNYLL
jgi:hypothetical protein